MGRLWLNPGMNFLTVQDQWLFNFDFGQGDYSLDWAGVQFEGSPGLRASAQEAGDSNDWGWVGWKWLCTDSLNEPVAPFPGLGGLAHSHSYLGHLLSGLLQCGLYGAAREDHLEILTGSECSSMHSNGAP